MEGDQHGRILEDTLVVNDTNLNVLPRYLTFKSVTPDQDIRPLKVGCDTVLRICQKLTLPSR